MTVLVPFKLKNPKTRLSNLLSIEERKKLAIFMLSDVLESVTESGVGSVVIAVPEESSASEISRVVNERKAEVVVDGRSLNDLVNHWIAQLSANQELAVIMADLPLLTPDLLTSFFSLNGDIVLSPGRKGGTNMLLVRNREFEVSYHYGSFMKHVEIAKSKGLTFSIFDSFFSSVDVDDESDVLELLIHGKGKRSREYLVSIGYGISCEEKDPRIVRKR
ncbi:MAG: 2-phospho-L-lactate guanylyltransferase [Archaeoglobus sp.]|nr:2-phospho-L-lactate guanylyltransferase [Archaeoglobus sp.]